MLQWLCAGAALVLHRYCTGTGTAWVTAQVLELLDRHCAATVQVLYRYWYWYSAGTLLRTGMALYSAGTFLGWAGMVLNCTITLCAVLAQSCGSARMSRTGPTHTLGSITFSGLAKIKAYKAAARTLRPPRLGRRPLRGAGCYMFHRPRMPPPTLASPATGRPQPTARRPQPTAPPPPAAGHLPRAGRSSSRWWYERAQDTVTTRCARPGRSDLPCVPRRHRSRCAQAVLVHTGRLGTRRRRSSPTTR